MPDGQADAPALLSRRTLVLTTGLSALAVGGLGACSSYGSGAEPAQQASTAPAEGSESTGGSSDSGGLAKTADIPVGGGTIFPDPKVVVTQPKSGEFKAFSAVCTHQGCLVAEVVGTINCTCHDSKFAITDGSVQSGPATTPLPAKQVSVSGDSITVSS